MLEFKYNIKRFFEVVNFVATTRRWYDRGNPRDAGEATPAKESLLYIMVLRHLIISGVFFDTKI